MIEVYFDRKDDIRCVSLRVSGHAGHDIRGKDIVCSAASILAYTLANKLVAEHFSGLYQDVKVSMYGSANIDCYARDKEEYERALLVFDVIVNGYRLLSESYPQCVKINTFGKA